MNLINKQVTHKHFGKGSVVKHTDPYIEIHFTSGNKKFVFPDAFGKYLTLIDQRAAATIKKMIQKMETKRKQEELELEKEKALQLKEQQRLLEHKKLMKNHKIHPSSQAVFWCKAQDQDRVFTEWSVFTGLIKSGSKKGQPNLPSRMHQNSACLLTARDPDMPEKDRYILGVYMVKKAFIGKLCEDGYIPAHTEYRLRLTEQESKRMLFWKYYINERYPHKMTWNTGKYRYFNNVWMAQILLDIVSLKSEPQERELAQRFFEHFCQMNQIEEKELPKPNGALMCI
ncbi:MAG: malate synthase [Bacillota bacterium]|nr:malate synthase [Bacillota bacterium]MDD3298440.1 malate synthase [Bacillota bacterium]MDD3851642.1 malate synthase [Bacillota bacterium]